LYLGKGSDCCKVTHKSRIDTIIPAVPSDGLLIGIGSIFADSQAARLEKRAREELQDEDLFSILCSHGRFSSCVFDEQFLRGECRSSKRTSAKWNEAMKKTLSYALVALATICTGVSLMRASNRFNAGAGLGQTCFSNDSGLKLPAGFCATVFADNIGHARHMVAGPNGILYVNTWSGRYYGNDTPHAGGVLVALQDKNDSGKADVIERFGETIQTGGHGGTGIALYRGAIYAEINDRIMRYSLSNGSIAPSGPSDTVISGLPLGGDHPMHPFIIAADGTMYVDVASATNSCQLKNRTPRSPGLKPCTELETRGGIWRYDAEKTNQSFSNAERYVTGIRNLTAKT